MSDFYKCAIYGKIVKVITMGQGQLVCGGNKGTVGYFYW
ncbi:MAG: desulfoferrodoxin FeS4 iron-binding domain-containing protein [Candidatus Aminicenantes bacterium]|nr:desulfoferrodoxin FeS4 iron-binding domain-containing protein [Candidatus Aminicenantes bacterium]